MSDDYQWPSGFWPHQLRGCLETVKAIAAGKRRIVFTSPTGGGKTLCMGSLIEWASWRSWESILYTNRRMLFQQTSEALTRDGIRHGMRAAGYKPSLLESVQLAMTPSEYAAVYRKKRRSLHPAMLALVDEIHMQNGGMMQQILGDHHDQGANIVAITATPIDLEGEWDALVVAGTNSELRKCGALVPAYTYCPDEPDLKHVKNYRIGEDLTDGENAKVMMRPGVFGRVYSNWERLNPEHKPTILFGPDVAGSLFFAEEFHKQGVRSAHIDAKQIWRNGEFLESSDENRQQLLKMTETGEVEVLCNRFVCLDSETEILTEDGWVGKDSMTYQHQVANWQDGRIYFEKPLEILKRQREPNEAMVVLETPRRSIRVTADHELLYRTNDCGAFTKARAEELVGRCVQLPGIESMDRSAGDSCTTHILRLEDHWRPEEVWCVTTSSGNIITRRKGSVTVMGNCREGINLPSLAVGILACVYGSLKTYLQSVGRILRASPGLDKVLLIDHGGNFLRHGSPNSDIQWELGMKGYRETGMRMEAMREKPELEPIRCPRCGMMRLSGPTCPACGHACHKRSRCVVQIDGELKQVEGPSFKPRRTKVTPDTEALWKKMYYRAKSDRWNGTFNQAFANFFLENHYYPPKTMTLMPTSPGDWFEKVQDVPRERLQ